MKDRVQLRNRVCVIGQSGCDGQSRMRVVIGQLHRGKEAAVEFRKLIEHPNMLINSPLESSARLYLARALNLSADPAGARKFYDDLFSLWKEPTATSPAGSRPTLPSTRSCSNWRLNIHFRSLYPTD